MQLCPKIQDIGAKLFGKQEVDMVLYFKHNMCFCSIL